MQKSDKPKSNKVKSKKTTSQRRKSTKKTTKKKIVKKQSNNKLKDIISIVFISIILLCIGYIIGVNSKAKSIKQKEFKNLTRYVHKVQVKDKHIDKKKLPKLVIIIDDVHTKKQLDALKSIHLHITPSIFPPYQSAWDTQKLVQYTKHYMIHIPMESSSNKFNHQTKTILTSWSQNQIDKRIKKIREMFPNAKYVNNHTGSVLTADYNAMCMVYKALRKNGFIFIDSYTTPRSEVSHIAKKYHDKYIRRDVFIDNTQNISYIKRQIKKAIKIAKKKGYAIIIGHPHKATIQALKHSYYLFKHIEVVYIDELFTL